jgi:hypothetical protein
MRSTGFVAGLLLVLAAAPVSAQSEREALVKRCDEQATSRKLSGAAQAVFMNECLSPKPAPAPAPAGRPAGAARPSALPSNTDAKSAQDEQFRKWDSAAKRALGSICTGCDRAPSRPAPRKARPAPVDDDGEYAAVPVPRRIDSDD